jgi:phenylalanyl-tRNA synthetase beta chain
VLRTSLIPQVVETLGKNRAHQVEDAALYEIGRVYRRAPAGGTTESTRLTIGLMGPVGRAGIDRRRALEPSETFLWAKGLLEALLKAMRVGSWSLQPASHPSLESGAAVSITIDGQPAGALGLVPQRIRREWRMGDPVAVLDLDVAALTRQALAVPSFHDIPAYPSVARDVAMIVGDDVRHEDIEQVIRKSAPAELESIQIFDIFKGGSIGPGRRSVAYSLTYRSRVRTLTDDEANGYHEAVKGALRTTLRAEIRES